MTMFSLLLYKKLHHGELVINNNFVVISGNCTVNTAENNSLFKKIRNMKAKALQKLF